MKYTRVRNWSKGKRSARDLERAIHPPPLMFSANQLCRLIYFPTSCTPPTKGHGKYLNIFASFLVNNPKEFAYGHNRRVKLQKYKVFVSIFRIIPHKESQRLWIPPQSNSQMYSASIQLIYTIHGKKDLNGLACHHNQSVTTPMYHAFD